MGALGLAAALRLAAALAAALGAVPSGAHDLERVGESSELSSGLLDLGGVGLVELVGGVFFLERDDERLQLVSPRSVASTSSGSSSSPASGSASV